VEDRMQGFGQGNAAAGPGCLEISAQIVNAYLRDGHGSQTLTSYSHCLLTLAAILYVDDTNMIHATPSVSATAQELISHTQDATNTWGGLAIATGAALKPENCFAYILNYKFINGRTVMGGMRSLPNPSAMILQNEGTPLPSHLTVPLPDGTCAPIPTIPNTTTSLTLGIWHAPSSRGTKHMKEMCSKGHNWVDRLRSRSLPHSEAWISFTHQLYPGMIWGLATVVLSAQELFAATRPV
jgi:hypothetical protein